jgi:hypothetical protein
MSEKMIRIDGELHRQIKTTAALYGMTIREFTERALRKFILPNFEERFADAPDEAEIAAEE